MAVVQSTYQEQINPAVAGMVADETTFDGDSRTCKTAAGIGFGLACAQSTADKSAVLGGALADFVGISVRDVTNENAVSADLYAENRNMTVMTRGDIWVAPSVAVDAGDVVHYSSSTGIFAKSGGSGPIVGARWITSCESGGLAILRLSGSLPAA